MSKIEKIEHKYKASNIFPSYDLVQDKKIHEIIDKINELVEAHNDQGERWKEYKMWCEKEWNKCFDRHDGDVEGYIKEKPSEKYTPTFEGFMEWLG